MNWDRFFRIMHEGVTVGTKMNWEKAARVDRVRKSRKYEKANKCTPAQKSFMKKLGIKYNNDVDKVTASFLISDHLKKHRSRPKIEKEKSLETLLLIFIETYKRRREKLTPDDVAAMLKLAEFLYQDLEDRWLHLPKVKEWRYEQVSDKTVTGAR